LRPHGEWAPSHQKIYHSGNLNRIQWRPTGQPLVFRGLIPTGWHWYQQTYVQQANTTVKL
jgi:hypothetical protein